MWAKRCGWYCAQVMNGQQLDKVHSNNLQAVQATKFIIQLSGGFIRSVFSCDFWFIFKFIIVTLSQHATSVIAACPKQTYCMHVTGKTLEQMKCSSDPWTMNNNRTWHFENSINLAKRAVVKFVLTRGKGDLLRPTVCYKLNRWPRSLSTLGSDE